MVLWSVLTVCCLYQAYPAVVMGTAYDVHSPSLSGATRASTLVWLCAATLREAITRFVAGSLPHYICARHSINDILCEPLCRTK